MVMLRAFATLLAGLLITVVVQAALAAVVRSVAPSWKQTATAGAAFVDLGSAFVAGAAGGFVTAWMAAINPLGHVMVLAIGVLVMAGFAAVQQRNRQHMAVQLAFVALTPLGVFAGGLLRLKLWGFF
jgi:hypothetical protein